MQILGAGSRSQVTETGIEAFLRNASQGYTPVNHPSNQSSPA